MIIGFLVYDNNNSPDFLGDVEKQRKKYILDIIISKYQSKLIHILNKKFNFFSIFA